MKEKAVTIFRSSQCDSSGVVTTCGRIIEFLYHHINPDDLDWWIDNDHLEDLCSITPEGWELDYGFKFEDTPDLEIMWNGAIHD